MIGGLRENLEELNPDMILWDGLDLAIVGTAEVDGTIRAVYSRKKCISIFKKRDGMSYEEAAEWIDFNMSPGTPGGDYPILMDAI